MSEGGNKPRARGPGKAGTTKQQGGKYSDRNGICNPFGEYLLRAAKNLP